MMLYSFLAVAAAGLLPVPALSRYSWDGGGSGLNAAGRKLADFDGQVVAHDFDDGTMGPFVECTTQSPNSAEVEDGRLKTYWTATGFDGERMTRGAEFCSEGDPLFRTQKEGWMGWTMNIKEGHSTISESAVAQVFCFDHEEEYFTWTAVLKLDQGNLEIHHRDRNIGTEETLMENVPFGEDLDIVLGWVASSQEAENGMFQVWVNGEQLYHAEGISLGFGQFDSDDVLEKDVSYITYKLGMYNYDDSTYTSGEERTIWYDNVSWYSGTDGFDVVDPSGGSSTSPVAAPVAEAVMEEEKGEDDVMGQDGSRGELESETAQAPMRSPRRQPATLGAWLSSIGVAL